jgi:GT2 family glycosyltransferase
MMLCNYVSVVWRPSKPQPSPICGDGALVWIFLMLSVIIPNRDSRVIDQVLGALEQQTARSQVGQVIIVGRDCCKRARRYPGMRFVATSRSLSAAAARNLGASFCHSDYLMFLDADCIAARDLVERLLARLGQGHKVVGGSVMPRSSNYWYLCDHMLIYAHFLSTALAGPRRYLPGGNLCIRSDVFARLGGFDERFPGAAGEDRDICLRLRERGYTLFFEPEAIVYHLHNRLSASTVWAHLYRFGQAQVRLWHLHEESVPSLVELGKRSWRRAIVAGAPLLALCDTMQLYRPRPMLRQYWRLFPGIVWAKLAWYRGVVDALLDVERQYTSTDAPVCGYNVLD